MKTVIEMAREAGAIPIHKSPKEFAVVGNEAIERFAELVRADEREACVKVCEEVGEESDSFTRDILRSTAATIRARSNT